MKFIMHVKDIGSEDNAAWQEPEDRPLKPFPETEAGARAWAEDCIKAFNNSLRPGERHRTVVRVEVISEGTSRHEWRKVSLVTEQDGCDRMRCDVCGVTGKRSGVNPAIRRDPKFKAKKFEKCGGVRL